MSQQNAIFIPVTDINWIPELAYREVDENHVKALVATNEPETWPPIIVTPGAYGDGCHYGLIAGQHRLLAAMDLDRDTILTEVKEYHSLAEMYLAMWEDNLRNGRPPTIAERKEHAVALHDAFPDMSYREIGKRAGIDEKTAKRAIMQSEKQEDEEPDEEQRDYNAGMQAPALRLIAAFNHFITKESNVFGSKHSERNIERRARALARCVKGTDESVLLFRSLAATFTQAAQFAAEKRAAETGKEQKKAGKK